MSLLVEGSVLEGHRARRERRRVRRALAAQDRVGARLAELFRIDALLEEAAHVVERGWLQHAWFTYTKPSGASVSVTVCTPRVARELSAQGISSACLVGAIVHAGGGPSQARSQLVQRALDLAWHASFRPPSEAIRWCPSSTERLCRAVDLVRWNDHPSRSADDVVGLLHRARDLTRAEIADTRLVQRDLSRQIDA
jgi:hypothetical protein